MCRLFAVLSTEADGDAGRVAKKLFTHGILLAEGKVNDDGTGLSGILDSEVMVAKSYLPAHEFCFTPQYLKFLADIDNNVFLGHTRNATDGTTIKGKHRTINAHPFKYGNIVGAHNGTFGYNANVINHEKLEGAEIDSAVFFALLAEEVGDSSEITLANVNAVINKLNSTSYSCLVINKKDPSCLYILKGTQSLVMHKTGPYAFIATDVDDITNTIYFMRLMFIPDTWDHEIIKENLSPRTMYKVNTKTLEVSKVGDLDVKTTVDNNYYARPYYHRNSIYGGADYDDLFSGTCDDKFVDKQARIIGKALFKLAQKSGLSWLEIDLLVDYLCEDMDDLTTRQINGVSSILPDVKHENIQQRMVLWEKLSVLLKERGAVFQEDKYNMLFRQFDDKVLFPWVLIQNEHLTEMIAWAEQLPITKQEKEKEDGK